MQLSSTNVDGRSTNSISGHDSRTRVIDTFQVQHHASAREREKTNNLDLEGGSADAVEGTLTTTNLHPLFESKRQPCAHLSLSHPFLFKHPVCACGL